MRDAISFCRLCMGACGTKLKIDESERIVEVKGDREHPLTAGYICSKGVDAAIMHNRADRLLNPLKRLSDGSFVPLSLDTALDEIAEILRKIIDRDGAEAVASFHGTMGYLNTTATLMVPAFMKAIGSPSIFSTLTIDQSAKVVAVGRMGFWAAGRQNWNDADVWMMFGSNPLVSIASSAGNPHHNPPKAFKAAKARGLKLIVIDPRRTETARYADLFLQPMPGHDAEIAAAMVRIILAEGREDKAFCTAYIGDLAALRAAVEPFTANLVAARAQIPVDDLVHAARLFATGPRGCTGNATGPNMGPHSNLAVHMIETLNVICGRFLRVGERVLNPGVTRARVPRRAEVIAAPRWWEKGHRLRTRNLGVIHGELGAELPAAALPDEILMPGKGQIKALLVNGANPVNAIPDQRKTVEALRALELLVTIDPLMATTAQLAHYVLPPKLIYERADLPMLFGLARTQAPFSQLAPAVVAPPAGAEVVDDWYVYWALAKRLGLPIEFTGVPLDMRVPPQTEDLLALLVRNGDGSIEELRKHPHGHIFDVAPQYVEPAQPGNEARFALMPDDVAGELAQVLKSLPSANFPYLLSVRRMRDVSNSLRFAPNEVSKRSVFNPVHIHPHDMEALGLGDGAEIELISDSGKIPGILEADPTMRPGVISMSHCWGGLPDDDNDYRQVGASTNLLISTERDYETINAMPRMSAIPVAIRARPPEARLVLTERGAYSSYPPLQI